MRDSKRLTSSCNRTDLVWRLGAVVLSLTLATGCNDNRPWAPSPMPPFPTVTPSPAPRIVTLSGTVFEHDATGVRPLSNIRLDVAEADDLPNVQSESDVQGRYVAHELEGRTVRVVAAASDYYQPCAVVTMLDGDTTLDVHLVRRSTLSTSGLPASFPIAEPRLTGRVFRRTTHGTRRMPSVDVTAYFIEWRHDSPVRGAVTMTDRDGRYLLCGLQPSMTVEPAFEGGGADSLWYEGTATAHDFEVTLQ